MNDVWLDVPEELHYPDDEEMNELGMISNYELSNHPLDRDDPPDFDPEREYEEEKELIQEDTACEEWGVSFVRW